MLLLGHWAVSDYSVQKSWVKLVSGGYNLSSQHPLYTRSLDLEEQAMEVDALLVRNSTVPPWVKLIVMPALAFPG